MYFALGWLAFDEDSVATSLTSPLLEVVVVGCSTRVLAASAVISTDFPTKLDTFSASFREAAIACCTSSSASAPRIFRAVEPTISARLSSPDACGLPCRRRRCCCRCLQLRRHSPPGLADESCWHWASQGLLQPLQGWPRPSCLPKKAIKPGTAAKISGHSDIRVRYTGVM